MNKMKKKTLVITIAYVFFYGFTYSQSINKKYKFPNTAIGKEALNVYAGLGYMPNSGNLSKYFKPSYGGTMSLSYFSSSSMAYFLSLNGINTNLKQKVSDIWQSGDSVTFYSFGLSVGYSIINHVHWRITPFFGLPFSESKPRKPTVKEYPELKQYKTGLKLSPEIGMNITYKIIKPLSYNNFLST